MSVQILQEYILSAVLIVAYFLYVGKGLLDTKISKSIKTIITILIFVIYVVFIFLFLDNLTRMIVTYIAILFSYRLLFKSNVSKCAIAAAVAYFFLVIGELPFTLIISLLYRYNIIQNIEIFKGALIANLFVSLIAVMIYRIFRAPLAKRLQRVKENNTWSLVLTFTSIMASIGSLLYKMLYNQWVINNALILNMVITISFVFIGIVIIKQYIDKVKINNDYEDYVRYSKASEKLVEQYSISQHENKNELIVIRSMVHKNNKKLLTYLDEIMSNKDNIDEAWVRYLRYIPFGGLKGFIHNKVSEMRESNMNVLLNISKDIESSCLKQLSIKENDMLIKIIGVFLDNAREASLETQEKQVTIFAYMNKSEVVFEISNTFANDVELSKIDAPGYSSKGGRHGYGLSLVRNIVEENDIFNTNTRIVDQYFIQKLIVHKENEKREKK